MIGRKLGITVLELQPCFCTPEGLPISVPDQGLVSARGRVSWASSPCGIGRCGTDTCRSCPRRPVDWLKVEAAPVHFLVSSSGGGASTPSGQQTPDCWGETIWVGHLKFLTSASFYHTDPLWEYPVFHGDLGTKTRTVKAGEETPLLQLLPERPHFLLDQPARFLCLFQVPSVVHLRGLFLGHRDHIFKGDCSSCWKYASRR